MRIPILHEPPGIFRVLPWPAGRVGLWLRLRHLGRLKVWHVQTLESVHSLVGGAFDAKAGILYSLRKVALPFRFNRPSEGYAGTRIFGRRPIPKRGTQPEPTSELRFPGYL